MQEIYYILYDPENLSKKYIKAWDKFGVNFSNISI